METMVIQNIYQKYINSDGDEQFQFANAGMYTVNFKRMIAILTYDIENKNEEYIVERAETHHRSKRSDPAGKFSTNIAAESLKDGNKNGYINYLGDEWQLRQTGKTR